MMGERVGGPELGRNVHKTTRTQAKRRYVFTGKKVFGRISVCVCGSKNSPLIPEPHGTDGIHRLSQHQQQERVNPPLFVQYALLSRTKYTVKVLLKITRKEIPPLTIC